MTKHKSLAILALGAAFLLTAALPASARDREERRNQKEPGRVSASSQVRGIQAGVKTTGNAEGAVSIRRERSPMTPARPSFMQKAICSGTCGDIEFTCWGESAYCEDDLGCVAEGGGDTIILVCLEN